MAFSLRKGRAAVLKAAALALIILLAILVAIIAWVIRSPLPKISGSISVNGISAPITIRRDDRGIPHIQASSESDLFFGQGFACAQDRLWQMDLLRRTAEGKLSEIVGPAALDVDRYMRTLGLGAAAQRDATALAGQALRDAQAYAAGVNAAASTHPVPIEFRLLGYRPQPWTPTDSIAIIKLMAQRLDDQWDLVELRALLGQKVGDAVASDLIDAQIPRLEHFINSSTSSPKPTARAGLPLSHEALALAAAPVDNPLPPDPQSGSNNWAVSGQRVSTGKPVLSNDTHLEHAVPSTYWLAQLKGGGVDVEGFIIPGIPFIALGHNERIAFGVTSGDIAVQDIYVEKFQSPTSDEYLANGRWIPAAHRIEHILIKGGKQELLDVLVTRHGPLVKRHGTTGYALAWTILKGGDEIDLLRILDLASNWAQFENALAHVVGPMFNWAYADIDGNIGYHLAGRVPNRTHGDGSLPVEGQDDRYQWHGYVAFDQLPHDFNPGRGFVATANNQLAPRGTQIGSSPFFDSPYRVDRIYQRLEARSRLSAEAIGAIQLDDIDTARVKLAEATAQALQKSPDARLRRIAVDLAAWNGAASVDSPLPTFLQALERTLTDQLLVPKLGRALTDRYRKSYNPVVVFDRVLSGNAALRSIGITRSSLLAALPSASVRAADAVGATATEGLKPGKAWGADNRAVFDHPLGRQWPINALLNIRPFPQPGDGLTVYAAKPEHGPASRLVADLSNWDHSSMILTLGESGQFNDKHYQDQVEAFSAVRWVPLPFSDAAVSAATKDTLVLNPNL